MTMTMTSRIPMALACTAALALLGAVALMSAGCDAGGAGGGAAPVRAKAKPAAKSTAKPAVFDPRDQYELARALDEVETARDVDATASGYSRLRASWTGKRYRWRVHVIAPLCGSRDACHVLPFDRGGRDAKMVQGWMPHLVLDDTGFAAIQERCGGRDMCQIEVEGTLSQLVVDTENPTSLEFRDVRVL
jgi:hypothetical protein